MSGYTARIHVTLKPAVLDPQGQTIRSGLERLGFSVQDVRTGKYFVVRLSASDRSTAEQQVRDMCEKLLANPVIEEFRYEVEPE